MPGQRPGAPQQRALNGVNPYQYPTVAHSPQDHGGDAGPNPQDPMIQLAEGSPRNQQPLNPVPATQGSLNPSGGAQVSTAPPTPSMTSSSITTPSPPTVNGITTQPTSLPEVPASFLMNEFMQSVANSLDDFDAQALFRPEDTGVNFEDFREWFNPDDLDTN